MGLPAATVFNVERGHQRGPFAAARVRLAEKLLGVVDGSLMAAAELDVVEMWRARS